MVGGGIGTDILRTFDGPFKIPMGNLLLTSFNLKSSDSEVYHYTVLNGTLKSRCFPAFPVQAM